MDHYCSVTCNTCPDKQNIIMIVGGHQTSPSKQWMLNPTFFSLNGSLPTCLASTKNNITNDGTLNKLKNPALFTNQGTINCWNCTVSFFTEIIRLLFADGNPVMCVGHPGQDECFKYEVRSQNIYFFHLPIWIYTYFSPANIGLLVSYWIHHCCWVRCVALSINVKRYARFILWHRVRRGWDYMEDVGLIKAGGIRPDSRIVELSSDGGQTFQHLAEIHWVRTRLDNY